MSNKFELLVEAWISLRCYECGNTIPIEPHLIRPNNNLVSI